jgi:hypothetical protein
MILPFAQGIDPNSGSNALMEGMKLAQEKRQKAIDNLMGQQRLQLDQQRLQAETARAQAEDERAKAQGRREDRLLANQERQQRQQLSASVLPYLDPTSEQFNPVMAQQIAASMGGSAQVQQNNSPPPHAPQQPQAPQFQGPIPSPQDAMAGALSGTRTDNPGHAGQVYVDQVENNSAHLLGPGGDDAFNTPATGLPRMPRESQWIPDPRDQTGADPMAQQAAQEAMQQQAERDQYARQLAEHPARQAQYAKEQQDYQLRKQFPNVQIDAGTGQPQTVDTLAMFRAAEGSRQMRAQHWDALLGDDEGAKKIAIPMATLGQPDKNIFAALEKYRAEAGRNQRAEDANQTRLDIASLRKKGGGAGAGGHGKAWQSEERELASELQKYEQTHGLTGKGGLLEKQREVEAAIKAGESNPNGLTQLAIMDKFIRNATGLGVRNQTLETYRGHLGGIAARGEGALEEFVNGKLGRQQWQAVMQSLRQQQGEFDAEGAKATEDYQRIKNSPAGLRHKDLTKRREDEMFGGLHGYGVNPLVGAARASQLSPAERATYERAKKTVSDPAASPQLKAKAQAVLKAVEGG